VIRRKSYGVTTNPFHDAMSGFATLRGHFFFLFIAMANDDKPSTSEILQSNITCGTFIEDMTV